MIQNKGIFISFEGGEGVGKSTQCQILQDHLNHIGIKSIVTREPGGSKGAEEIRELLVRGDTDKWEPITEVLLLNAARADHLHKTILPALNRGEWVICDRFVDSTFAYQGLGQNIPQDILKQIHEIATHSIWPDITFILNGYLLNRAIDRENKSQENSEDRYEKMGNDFHEKLQKSFLKIADQNPDRCHVIDASGSEKDVFQRLLKILLQNFSELRN